jgi:exopolyphosphatase / guanosine-5'-triphosphate,3'-diphosphate pyrophosphatase
MQIGIIDIGTNTFHLLISKSAYVGVADHVESYKVPVKLGENGITEGIISPEAFQRGIDSVKYFHGIIKVQKIEEVYAFATSAVRRASNRDDFMAAVKDATGIKIDVISGDKEAEYIYYGVHQAVELGEETSLIMDIGGGSVEFILGNAKEIFWKGSFDVGAALLLEKFRPSDPITEDEKNTMLDHISLTLQPLFEAFGRYPAARLIGSSGSFDTLADVVTNRFHSPDILNGKTEYTFNYEEVQGIINEIIYSTHAAREQIKGIAAMRIDMIVVGCVLIDFIITKFEIRNVKLSAYALKEGVLWQVLKQGRIEV